MSYIKFLQEKKKEKMLENKRDKLKKEIEDLENENEEKIICYKNE